MSAQYLSETEMAKAQRDYELKKATYDIEVNTRRAQADLAYQLQVSHPRGRHPLSQLPLRHILTLLPTSDPAHPDEGNLKDPNVSAKKQRKGREVYDL